MKSDKSSDDALHGRKKEIIKKLIRVAILTNIPNPYQIAFFRKLSSQKNIDIFVYYCSNTESDRDWRVDFGYGYNFALLPGITLKKIAVNCHINPSILKILYQKDYDLVIVGGGYKIPTMLLTILYLNLFHKKWILWSERIRTDDSGIIYRKIKLKLLPIIIETTSGLIAIGKWARESFRYYGAKKEKICVTPYCSQTCISARNKNLNSKDICELNKKITLLYVGQLIYRKGVDVLLKAFVLLQKYHSNISLFIVGDGNEKESLQALCRNMKISNVKFIGFVQPEKLSDYYEQADIFVFPSRYDGWGVVINEAMEHRLPIISTNRVGATYDLVKNNVNGYIVNVDDVNSLYDRIDHLLNTPTLIQTFGDASQKIIQRLSPEICAKQFSAYIKKVVAK